MDLPEQVRPPPIDDAIAPWWSGWQERARPGATAGSAGLLLRSPFTSVADIGAQHYPFLPVQAMLRDRFPILEIIGAVTVRSGRQKTGRAGRPGPDLGHCAQSVAGRCVDRRAGLVFTRSQRPRSCPAPHPATPTLDRRTRDHDGAEPPPSVGPSGDVIPESFQGAVVRARRR
jgi:hypothetical protein